AVITRRGHSLLTNPQALAQALAGCLRSQESPTTEEGVPMKTTKHTRRGGRLAAVALTATLLAAGCSGGDDGGGEGGGDGGGDGDVVVGLVTKTDSNPFFVQMREAAQDYADENGVELVALAGEFDGDNEGQVTAIENLISQQVDGILITPNSSSGILDAISPARDAGVMVIALD